jgi:hypothetical protein
MKRIIVFFDKLEDLFRAYLSHRPILYSLVGAVGIILLWKGVWEVAEFFPILHGWGSIIAGAAILLGSGLLVSFFIGDSIIISGLKREKKLVEREEVEILKAEETQTKEIMAKLDHIQHDIHALNGEPERIID